MKKIIYLLLVTYSFSSCINVKKIEESYQMFQRGFDTTTLSNYKYVELKLKEGDNITIQVFTTATQDQSQVVMFNLQGAGIKQGIGNYVVSNTGTIDLAKIGSLKVVGLTCTQVKEIIKNEWSRYVKDISVDVQLTGFSVNVLGEVRVPGNRVFKSEKATIIDAISQSGGLNDDGKRENILVVREENGKRNTYRIDLRDAKIYDNPAFQLQQNDMIYVEAGESKFKGIRTTRFQQTAVPITSLANLGLSVVNMIIVLFVLRKN